MPSPSPQDVASPEAIIRRAYELLSGRAREARDWDSWKALHAPGARLIPLERGTDGKLVARVFTPEEFIASRALFLSQNDFHEWESARVEQRFGAFAHVWSTYEAAAALHGTPIIRRGVNSIQLWDDGARWWILSVLWDAAAAITSGA
jgi:hypothetical protein